MSWIRHERLAWVQPNILEKLRNKNRVTYICEIYVNDGEPHKTKHILDVIERRLTDFETKFNVNNI